MAYPVRSVKQREGQIIADVQSETGQTIPPIEESWDRIWAIAIAGLAKIADLAIVRGLKNILPNETQDLDVLGVFGGWANVFRGEKTQTILNVIGTGTVGQTIGGGPSGVQYVSEDGQKFYFAEDYIIPSASFTTQLTAYIAGAQANLSSGELSITGQNAHISSVLTIDTNDPLAAEGRDEEILESYRDNVNRGLQRPILADNYSYYYATSAATPSREILAGYAYVVRPGQIEVYNQSVGNNGEPTATQLQAVSDWYNGVDDDIVKIPPEYSGTLPDVAEDRFLVKACSNTVFKVRVTGIAPDNATTRELIGQDIFDYFEDRAPYVRGASISNNGLIEQNGLRSIMQSRIESGDIQKYTNVELALDDVTFVPLSTYTLGKGELSRIVKTSILWPAS